MPGFNIDDYLTPTKSPFAKLPQPTGIVPTVPQEPSSLVAPLDPEANQEAFERQDAYIAGMISGLTGYRLKDPVAQKAIKKHPVAYRAGQASGVGVSTVATAGVPAVRVGAGGATLGSALGRGALIGGGIGLATGAGAGAVEAMEDPEKASWGQFGKRVGLHAGAGVAGGAAFGGLGYGIGRRAAKVRIGRAAKEAAKPFGTQKAFGAQYYKQAIPVGSEKYAFNLNLDRLQLTKAGRTQLKKTVAKLRPELEDIKGKPLTFQEIVDEAKKVEMLTGTVSRQEVKQEAARLLKVREFITTASNTLDEAGGAASEADWQKYMNGLKTFSSYASEKGRALRSLGINAEDRTLRDKFVGDLLKKGVEAKKIIEAAKNVDFKDARQASTFYRGFVKATRDEWIDYIRYISMLSNPKTQIINILGNLFQAPLATAEKLAAGGIDLVASVLKPGRQRQHFVREVPRNVRGFLSAIPQALKDANLALSGKTAIARPDIPRVPIATRGPAFHAGFGLRFMEGMDVFFRTTFKAGAKEGLAYRYARMGKTIDPAKLANLAENEALYRIFRTPLGAKSQGYLLNTIDDFTKQIYKLRALPGVKWFIPFVQTPMNIMKQGLEFSPAGLATIPGASDKVTQLAKASVGSLVWLGAGWLALQDRTTWAPPRGEKERQHFFASGRIPYSIKIGDHWVSFSKLGPIAFPIAMATGLKYYNEDKGMDETALDKATNVLGGMARFWSDQTYLQGVNNLVAVIKGEPYAIQKALGDIPRQIIPFASILQMVTTLTDHIYRKAETPIQKIERGIPGLSKRLEPHTTPTGEPSVRQYPYIQAFSPFQFSKEQPEYEAGYQKYQADRYKKRKKATARKKRKEARGKKKKKVGLSINDYLK